MEDGFQSIVSSIDRRSVLVGLAAAVVACGRREHDPHGFDKVFSGFDFVGEFPLEDEGLTSHPHESARLPPIWVPGPQFIFHLEEDHDFEEIPTRLIPDRLRSVQAIDIVAPTSWRDMAIPNTGNPFWAISFTQGRYRGEIRNRLEMKRYSRFAGTAKMRRNQPDPRIDDYVLSFKI